MISVVYFFKLEVTVPSSGDIFFSSGTPQKQVLVETTLLLPVLFVIVAALFATVAQRMARRDVDAAAAPGLHHQHPRQPGRGRRLCRDVVAGAFADLVVRRRVRRRIRHCQSGRGADSSPARPRCVQLRGPADLLARPGVTSCRARPSGRRTTRSRVLHRDAETIVEVNNIFHQSMAPVDQKEYFYQWPYMAFGNTLQERADPRRRIRHRRRRGAAPRRRARGRRRDRSGDHPARANAGTRIVRTSTPASP